MEVSARSAKNMVARFMTTFYAVRSRNSIGLKRRGLQPSHCRIEGRAGTTKLCVARTDCEVGSPRPLLLFTSHRLAKDYIHATGTEAEVGGVKTEDIFESAKEWFSTCF